MGSDASPWQLGGLSMPELATRVWDEFWDDEIPDRAAALSYYFLFALFPTLLFLTALVAFLPVPHLMDQLMMWVSRMLPGDAGSTIHRTLGEVVSRTRSDLISAGAVVALWSSSSGMASVMSALNIAYGVDDARPWWRRRLVAILLTVGFTLFVVSALVLMVFGPHLGNMAARFFGLGDVFTVAWNVVSVPLAISFVLVGIALVYYFAPAVEQRWRWVTPGSVIATALWVTMSVGLRIYVAFFANYNATYGSIGGVILLLLWLYLTGVVLLLGAELNAEIEHAAAHRGEPTAKAPGERQAAASRTEAA